MEKIILDDPKDWPGDVRVTLEAAHEDERGFIQCLVNLPTRNISFIFSKKGSVRSNHYHKTDWHYMYILSGRMDYYYRPHGDTGEIKKEILKKGDMVFTPPVEEHTTYFPEDTHFLAISRNPRDQKAYEADVVRVQLVDPESLACIMDKDCYRRDSCRLCNHKKLEDVIELTPTPPGNNFLSKEQLDTPESFYPLIVRFCQHCFHVQLADVVNPKILYQDDYKYVSSTSPVFVEHFRQYAEDVLAKYIIPTGAFVVDIGSNDGTCLRFFKEAGYNVLGVDPATEIATKATAQGIPTVAAFFSESLGQKLLKENGPAYLITSHNTCAHIDDLAGIMRGVRHWLADDGLFIFEVGYLLDIYRNTWFDTMYHEHLDYHSVKPFVPFFESLKMELLSVKRVSPQGGSLRLHVQKKGGPRCADSSVGELVRLEEEIGLDKAETFRTFNEKINAVKKELSGILRSLKTQGKRIAGYGAPTKSTTLLTHFGLGNDIIDFIVDDNPLKHGKFTPGFHIPIMGVEELYKRMPDYLVVLSWNFAEPIMEKHKEYKNRGGKFILPMPKAHVVE